MKKLFFIFLIGTFAFSQEKLVSQDSLTIIYTSNGVDLFHKTLSDPSFRFLEKGEKVVFFDVEKKDKITYYKGYTKIDSGYVSAGSIDANYVINRTILPLKNIKDRMVAAKSIILRIPDFKELEKKEKNICDNVTKIKDKFTDEITIYTSYNQAKDYISKTTYYYPSFHKIINSGKASYFLSLETHGSIPVIDGRKAYIIFSDGTKWMRDVPIDVDVSYSGSHYVYSAWIRLSQSDLNIFKQKRITDFRLDIFEDFLNEELGKKLKEEFNCILNKN